MVSADVITKLNQVLRMLAIGLMLTPAAALAQDEVVYYHTDAIGSVRMVTDATGAVVARYDYMPFGETWPTNPPNTAPDVRQFAGKERDVQTDLDYFGARYYRASSGRFVSVDPVLNFDEALTDPQRWNRYVYVSNRPFTFSDPDGRDPRLLAGGIGSAVYGVWQAVLNARNDRPWYKNVHSQAAKGFLVGLTLGLAAPALGMPAAIAAAEAVGGVASGGAIGFAAGTARSAFVSERLQHASDHLSKAGILGNWSKATGEQFIQMGSQILEKPTATFDYVLRGGEAVKGFAGTVGGKDVVFFVYKTGDRAGQIATAVVPSADQLQRWGLR